MIFFVAVGTYAAMSGQRHSVVYVAVAAGLLIFLIRRVILPRWLRRRIPDAFGSRAAT